ncbi:hypothetical protein HO133_006954 [Letharia lupina]|uniref:Uncharacterized protein n=1 Tax=Letharia lupina TaxID=560253 RepID=A0A8H6FI08_9LECA|nr:uncharacterized protein HO133_006954 [Letharia lupina]KAF6228843.1 hypothetical protein HO133_006954 [Letharia lupina]
MIEMVCTNRPEGFGPLSHLYSHMLTSCFLDTILVPLCTWVYLLALVILAVTGTRLSTRASQQSSRPSDVSHYPVHKTTEDVEIVRLETGGRTRRHAKTRMAFSILFYLLIFAQIVMCILEIVRLSYADRGIGLLPFTFVTLVGAAMVHYTQGLEGMIFGWKYLNLAVWIALAVTNGVKVAEEIKEGTGATKGSKYPVSDEMTDVSVMIGVYGMLAILEGFLGVWRK